MTREELEEGRRLRDACNNGDALEYIGSVHDFEIWLRRNADKLISLAEEARWRDMETEPPPHSTTLLGYDRFYEKVKTCSWGPNDRLLVFDDGDDDCDIVKWRPLGEPK